MAIDSKDVSDMQIMNLWKETRTHASAAVFLFFEPLSPWINHTGTKEKYDRREVLGLRAAALLLVLAAYAIPLRSDFEILVGEDLGVWMNFLLVAFFGCLGGIYNMLLGRMFGYVRVSAESEVPRLGLVGNALVGGASAFAIWGFFGPFSASSLSHMLLQLGGALYAGFFGSRLVQMEIDRRVHKHSREELKPVEEAIDTAEHQSSLNRRHDRSGRL